MSTQRIFFFRCIYFFVVVDTFHCFIVTLLLLVLLFFDWNWSLFSVHLFESIYIAPASNDKYTRHHNHDDNGAQRPTTTEWCWWIHSNKNKNVKKTYQMKRTNINENDKLKTAIKCNSINRIPVGYSVFFFVCSFDVLIVNCPSRKGFGFFLIWKKGEWGNFLVHKISSFQPCLEKAIICFPSLLVWVPPIFL